jgi:ElaB/YqjD/DUF883 family membrane-anchored ribosome-binding protein
LNHKDDIIMRNSNVQSRMDSQLDSIRDSVKHFVDIGEDTARSGIKQLGRLIKDHPVAAVAIAFGVGYLAMRILRR